MKSDGVVDLSPDREAALWITLWVTGGRERGPAGPAGVNPGLRTPVLAARHCAGTPVLAAPHYARPSWQRASHSAASTNSASEVPGRNGRPPCPGAGAPARG